MQPNIYLIIVGFPPSTQPTKLHISFRNLPLNTTAHQYLYQHILNLDVVESIGQ
ncbi:MAG: hypothetical protein F6K40_17020 [Okeania sp. SIO3I5]|uniref:hypothetical protein n=1 Tax=Okeania sp. SIO3I5 TaxID=2607805 RepID=UPI0013BE8842|nr:hypothetical protein [Okeania sp. SIO3I5]NEQ37868.1 hypothetical protein [Okeania sp. SIO3I5]